MRFTLFEKQILLVALDDVVNISHLGDLDLERDLDEALSSLKVTLRPFSLVSSNSLITRFTSSLLRKSATLKKQVFIVFKEVKYKILAIIYQTRRKMLSNITNLKIALNKHTLHPI